MTLADLPFAALAKVSALDGSEASIALMELGIVPGTPIRVLRRAPFGCPLEVDVAGARLAIRRGIAARVSVQPAG